ncbi:hypothetical protein L0F81_17380 [Streptomyces tricolor]|uniref:DUF3618 domain-containing protein n=1 Tax=Streptomyces tricolor TaxID=68277 RepID=A0ABS9JHK1_9ACTN|nr:MULTISPECIES: hypothetical protein [Streptomyces]MCG0065047.1 hypothetical protein [Streptomyces tricolor]
MSVALELERLRGTCETGFTRVDGQLALLVQRGDQTDKDIAELKAEVEALKRARWPLPSIAAVVSVSALGVTLWQAAGR